MFEKKLLSFIRSAQKVGNNKERLAMLAGDKQAGKLPATESFIGMGEADRKEYKKKCVKFLTRGKELYAGS